MRLFVALDIDPEIRQRIAEFCNQMRAYAPDVKWVAPESFHITLQFLGETNQQDQISNALRQVKAAPVALSFRGTGFFPSARSPRVFWVGISSDEHLQALAGAVGDVLRPVGFEPERENYTPHLTLARAGSGRPKPVRGEHSNPGLRALALKLEGAAPTDFGSMTAREFYLYESKLSAAGPKYTRLVACPLA